MIANVGGYVGLFLGYSLLEIPAVVMSLFSWIQNLFVGAKFKPTIVANRTNTCNNNNQTISYDDISNMKQDIEDIKKMLLSLQQNVATSNSDGHIQ